MTEVAHAEHGDYRAIVEPFFNRPKLPEMIAQVEHLIDSLLRDAIARDTTEVVHGFALPLQARALTYLLNTAESEADLWIGWGIHVFRVRGGLKKGVELENYLDACAELLLPQTTVLVGNHSTLWRWLLPDWSGERSPNAREIAKAAAEYGVPYTLVTGISLPDQHIDNVLASPVTVLARADMWVGQQTAFALTPGLAIRQNMVRPTKAFAAGDQVRVNSSGSGFSISVTGLALTAGLVGQPARIRLPGGRVVTGLVQEDQTVEMSL